MKMAICVYLCCGKFIVCACCKFSGIATEISSFVSLCFDECIVIGCCKFGGIGMKMASCVFLCCDECIVTVCFKFGCDPDENGHLCLFVLG